MDQDIIIDSLGKQLDLLENLTKWGILFGLAVVWTGLNRREDSDLLGLKVKRRESLYVGALVFIIANIIFVIQFLRITSLIILLRDEAKIVGAVTKLATHTWLFNPFAYFGPYSDIYAGAGFGLLIILWWFAFSALASLEEEDKRHSVIISNIFLATGLCSLGAVQLSMFALLGIVDHYNNILKINTFFVFGWRTATTFLGIIVGGLIYKIVLYLKTKLFLDDSKIRERAYYIWLESGQPSGMSEEHWKRARQECEREVARK